MLFRSGTGPDEPSMRLQLEFMRSASGIWNLFRAVFSDEQMCLDIDEDTVAFRPAADPDSDRLQTVTVTLERDLRHMNLAEIPKTPEQAQP